jgi:hypothetical protein
MAKETGAFPKERVARHVLQFVMPFRERELELLWIVVEYNDKGGLAMRSNKDDTLDGI